MWINMNDSILAIIMGSMLGFLCIGLPAIIVRAVYLRRTRAAKEKNLLEPQTMNMPQESPLTQKPTSLRRSIVTFIVMTLLIIIWGLMVGFAVGVFSHLIYIVFLIPVVMGINNGKMIVDVIQRAKVRTTAQLVLLSILSAVVMYGSFHYTRYLGFQLKASMEIFSGLSEAMETENLQATRLFLDYALEEETGHSGFPGYILYEARQGVAIGRLFRSSSVNLGPLLTWLYWLMEFGIILGLTFQKGKKAMGASFCEACGNWYGGEKHLGGTTAANEHLLLNLIKQKDFIELGKLLEKNAELPSTEVYFQGCQVCGSSQSQLIVRRASQGAKGILHFTDSSQTILQPRDSVLLLNQTRSAGD
jgi:hypothetical protein